MVYEIILSKNEAVPADIGETKMMHTNLIANELQDSGFKVRIVIGPMIEVSLDNRKVSQMEIQYELDRKFEGIEFNLSSTSNSVLVTV